MNTVRDLVTTGTRAVPMVEATVGDATVFARPAFLPEFMTLVRDYGTLYGWAASQPQPRALRGRAPVYVATLPAVGRAVVVRHAWHGGLLAPLTSDLFRKPTRAAQEVANSVELRARGIPTTDVVAYALYRAPLGLVRVDVATAYVDDTADLGMIIAGLAPAVDGDGALRATLDLLVRLARQGVVHPDLNVKNILVRAPRQAAMGQTSSSQVTPEALIIDVDVVRFNVAPREAMARNVARLTRSMHKFKRSFGCDVADQRIKAFAAEALARTPQDAPGIDPSSVAS